MGEGLAAPGVVLGPLWQSPPGMEEPRPSGGPASPRPPQTPGSRDAAAPDKPRVGNASWGLPGQVSSPPSGLCRSQGWC